MKTPIGIIDSGIGGLTIFKEILRELPHESIVYLGDSLRTPYGAKSPEEIYQLSKQLIEYLLTKHVKLIVIACNTITVSCLDRLRREYPHVPLIGTVPVVKTAAALTRTKRIGILSTTRTAESAYQKHLIERFADDCVVVNVGTDTLVPLIERGEISGVALQNVVKQIVVPFQKEGIDILALGCTHFPFITKQLQEILGSKVRLLDSGAAVARHVHRVLEKNNGLVVAGSPTYEIITTGSVPVVKKVLVSIIEEKKMQQMHFSTITL